jgi:hypothetical protein
MAGGEFEDLKIGDDRIQAVKDAADTYVNKL